MTDPVVTFEIDPDHPADAQEIVRALAGVLIDCDRRRRATEGGGERNGADRAGQEQTEASSG